ncbi:MAG: hypothetical protein AMXMBFR58_35940 [Phycisphaerae bacterium]|nr:hypothetical protein [Phycisphaerales bacterium]
MWAYVRTFLIVTTITVLIWTFAEAESLTTRTLRTDLDFAIDPQTQRFIEVTEKNSWTGRVEAVFEGSTASMGELESLLRRGLVVRPGSGSLPSEPGSYDIDLAQILRSIPEIDRLGVSVTKAEPPTVHIAIDTLVTRDVQIVPVVLGAVVDGIVESKPGRAKMTLPRSLADRLPADATVSATVSADAVEKLVPGRTETVPGVTLRPPAAMNGHPRVIIDPDRADVILKLKARTDVFTMPSVPVHIKIAVGEIGRWEVTVPDEDRFIRDVKISGPSDLVEQVRRGQIKITAVLSLSFDELERGIATKDVVFSEIPTELKFDADRTTVRLRIARRPSTTDAAEPGS